MSIYTCLENLADWGCMQTGVHHVHAVGVDGKAADIGEAKQCSYNPKSRHVRKSYALSFRRSKSTHMSRLWCVCIAIHGYGFRTSRVEERSFASIVPKRHVSDCRRCAMHFPAFYAQPMFTPSQSGKYQPSRSRISLRFPTSLASRLAKRHLGLRYMDIN